MTAWLAIIAPAWIAGSILALLSAPLGCLVLWRRMAFFADALAHGTLLGVALAVLWQLPMGIGIGIVSVMVVLGLVLIDDERLPVDAVLAVVAVSLLCLGLLTLTQLTDQQANVLGFLFEGTKLSEEDIALYEQWNAYKKEKNFDEADRVRKELTERGIL